MIVQHQQPLAIGACAGDHLDLLLAIDLDVFELINFWAKRLFC
jgi:hypothetical protein